MGAPFPQSFIEAVRDAADIVRVISDYVPLKQAGARLKGLCPFHDEKTPSFTVDPRNQLFYCFGCQTGGDLFKFVMLFEKQEFPEAVEGLARRFGVPVPKAERRSRGDEERERLQALSRAAADYYRATLQSPTGRSCRQYLDKRGIDSGTAERLGLGYAPDAWEALAGHLRSKGFTPAETEKAGLALPRKSGSGHYDRFRNRLIFPIRDLHGRTIAFGGRALGDAEPKYINSPETLTYIKGDHLYGLDLARDAIRREGFAVVVEGYLDLAALVQAGFEQVVASLGTAFTATQARLLARFTDRVLVCYDGDTAGAKATARSLDLLLDKGFEVRVVELPGSMDPDDFIRAEGATAYERLLREAPDYLEFLVRREAASRDLDRVDEKVAAVNAVLPHLARLGSPIERAAWVGRLADALRIDDDLVLQELRAVLKSARTRVRSRPQALRPPRWDEARLVSVLLRSADERSRLASLTGLQDLAGTRIDPLVRAILRLHAEGGRVDYPAVQEGLASDEQRALLTQIVARDEPEDGPTVDDCLCAFKREELKRKERDAIRRLDRIQAHGAERPADGADMDEWLTQVQQLAQQRDALH